MKHQQSGYVLVLTIAALALLGLVGAFIGQRVSTALRLAATEQDYVRDERLARDAMARFIYLTTTVHRAPTGLGGNEIAIRMDGRWYDAENGMLVSFQDGRGLINLKTAPRLWKERLLGSYGVPVVKMGSLIDALDDYTDSDSLRRLEGAEADDYIKKGRSPPRNLPLSIKEEIFRVYGWKEEKELWGKDSFIEHVTLDDNTGINPATATWRTMVAAFGLQPQIAQEFVAQRFKLDAKSAYEFSLAYATRITGENILDLNGSTLFPSTSTQITIARNGGRRAWRSTITLTPESPAIPWQLLDMREITLDQPAKSEKPQKIPDMSPFKSNATTNSSDLPF